MISERDSQGLGRRVELAIWFAWHGVAYRLSISPRLLPLFLKEG